MKKNTYLNVKKKELAGRLVETFGFLELQEEERSNCS